MGIHRRINQINAQAEVQLRIADEIGTPYSVLFDIWKKYVVKRLSKEKDIVKQLRESPEMDQQALDYFTTIGFELFALEYVKEYIRGK